MAEISKITLPSGTTYDLKDATARSAIESLNSFTYLVCTSAANTPKDVTWDSGGTTITGTLVASADTMYKIYLVPGTGSSGDIYSEYITVNPSGSTYTWERFGSTEAILGDLGDMAYVDTASTSYTPGGSVSLTITDKTAKILPTAATESTVSPSFTTLANTTVFGNSITTGSSGNSVAYFKCDPSTTYKLSASFYIGVGWTKVVPAAGVNVYDYGSTRLFTGKDANYIVAAFQSSSSASGITVTKSTATYAPAGTVTLTKTDKTATVAPANSGDATYTPAGSVTLTKTNKTATVSAAESGDATYTPAGSVTLTKTNKTATVSAAGSGEATYTPAGSVSLSTTSTTPTITASAGSSGSNTFQCSGSVAVSSAGSTDTVNSATKKTVALSVNAAAPGATAPSNAITYYSVSGETLSLYQLGYTTGDSITVSSKTVKTGDASYSFTGGYVSLANSAINLPTSASFTGTGARLVTGNISTADSASFSGTGARLVTGNISTADSASFSGTGVRLVTGNISTADSASFAGTAVNLETDDIPTADSATFSGTAATIQVTPDSNS